MGYSKPPIDGPIQIVNQTAYRYGATSDGVDDSIPLAVSAFNKIDVATDVSIRPEDEMSMRYLLGVPAYFGSFAWSGGTTPTTTILNTTMGPSVLYSGATYMSGTKLATYKTGPPIWFLSNYFQFWRGSIKVRIKIVKTQFHTGRLLITWTPTYGTVSAPADSTFSLRHYVDIRDSDEITLDLPFMVPQVWLSQSDSSGYLNIAVQNILRAPETCAQTISVLVYFSAGDDFQFAGPLPGGGRSDPVLMVGNADTSDDAGRVLVREVIGGEVIPRLNLKPNMLCMGEYITSIKQLINRNSLVGSSESGASMSVNPWFFGAVTTSAGTLQNCSQGGDPLSIFGLMYAFYRGSMRVLVSGLEVNCSVQLIAGADSFPFFGPGNQNSPTYQWYIPGASFQGPIGTFYTDSSENAHGFLIPYYNTVRMSLLDFSVSSNNSGVDYSVPTVGLQVNGTSANNILLRSAGEDFQLSYFIGCPPLLISLV
jgi:hypothetical protein